jgi:hypothetical protein
LLAVVAEVAELRLVTLVVVAEAQVVIYIQHQLQLMLQTFQLLLEQEEMRVLPRPMVE